MYTLGNIDSPMQCYSICGLGIPLEYCVVEADIQVNDGLLSATVGSPKYLRSDQQSDKKVLSSSPSKVTIQIRKARNALNQQDQQAQFNKDNQGRNHDGVHASFYSFFVIYLHSVSFLDEWSMAERVKKNLERGQIESDKHH